MFRDVESFWIIGLVWGTIIFLLLFAFVIGLYIAFYEDPNVPGKGGQ